MRMLIKYGQLKKLIREQAAKLRESMVRETSMQAEWPFDEVTGEVTVSGMVSPVSPATWDDPAEGGVEDIRVTDMSGEELPLSDEQKDWAAEVLLGSLESDNYQDF